MARRALILTKIKIDWEELRLKLGLLPSSVKTVWSTIKRKLRSQDAALIDNGVRLGYKERRQLAAVFQSLKEDGMIIDYGAVATELGVLGSEDAKSHYEKVKSKLQTTKEYAFGPRQTPSRTAQPAMKEAAVSRKQYEEHPVDLLKRPAETAVSAPSTANSRKRPRTGPGELSQDVHNRSRKTKMESDPYRDPVELLLFIMSCNRDPVRPSWPEIVSRSGRAHSTMFTRFFRILNDRGWQLKDGELTKLSTGQKSNRVTGSKQSLNHHKKITRPATIDTSHQQNAVNSLSPSGDVSTVEAQEGSTVIKEESPEGIDAEIDADEPDADHSPYEEDVAPARAPGVSNAAVKLRLQDDEDDMWDW